MSTSDRLETLLTKIRDRLNGNEENELRELISDLCDEHSTCVVESHLVYSRQNENFIMRHASWEMSIFGNKLHIWLSERSHADISIPCESYALARKFAKEYDIEKVHKQNNL